MTTFKFHCLECNSTFTIDKDSFLTLNSLKCVSCGKVFPKKQLTSIQDNLTYSEGTGSFKISIQNSNNISFDAINQSAHAMALTSLEKILATQDEAPSIQEFLHSELLVRKFCNHYSLELLYYYHEALRENLLKNGIDIGELI